MIMQLESIEQKQKFLRSEIYEKGIDPQGFMDFMGTVKGEGENIDLDNWTLSQLKNVVGEYKKRLNQSKIELMQSRLSRDIKKSIFLIPKKQKFKYQGTNLYDFEEKYEQECTKTEVVFELIHNLITPKIQIQQYQIKSVGGFIFGIGARNQLEFTISSNFTNKKVVRKDEDCFWLKKILTEKYVGVFVPPLSETVEYSIDDKRGINARIEQVTTFVNTLLNYSFFRCSNDFNEFMTQQQYKKFTEHRNKQSNFVLQKTIMDIESPSGSFNVEISQKLNQEVKKSAQLTQDLNNLYTELGPSLNRIVNDIDTVSRSIKNYYEITTQIGQKYNQIQKVLRQQVKIALTQYKLPTILISINSSIQTIIKNLKQNIKSLYSFNDTYIKPTTKDFNQIILINRRQQAQLNNYLSFKETLLKKKQKFINDPTKWELPEVEFMRIQRQGKLSKQDSFDVMFPNDNERENQLRVWLSFINQNYLKSLRLFFTQHEHSLLENYLSYSQKYLASSIEINQGFEAFRQIVGI